MHLSIVAAAAAAACGSAGGIAAPAMWVAAPSPVHAPASADENHATASLIAEHAAFVPGQTTTLGIHFKLEKHWHLYWNGQSDTGMPPQVELTLPEGFTAGEILWPAPKRLAVPGGMLDYVYEDQVTLLIPIKVDAAVKPSAAAEMKASLRWLVCKDVCVAGDAELSLALPVSESGASLQASKDAPRIEAARKRLPQPWPNDESAPKLVWEGRRLTIQVADAAKLAFYAGMDGATLVDAAGQGLVTGNKLILDFDIPEQGVAAPIRGVLEIWPRTDTKPTDTIVYSLNLPIPSRAGAAAEPPAGR